MNTDETKTEGMMVTQTGMNEENNTQTMTILIEDITKPKREIITKVMMTNIHPTKQEQKIMDGYVKEMKEQIIDLRGKIPVSDEGAESLEHNIKVISKYKAELESLDKRSIQPLEQ